MVLKSLTMLLFALRIKSHLWGNIIHCNTKLLFSDLAIRGNHVLKVDSCIGKLCELLECSEGNAGLLVRKNKKLLTINSDRICRVALLCKNNLKLCDVLGYPAVMSLSPFVLNDRISTLKELGCRAVNARKILLFDQFMQTTPSKLRWKGFLTVPETSFIHIVDQLKCPKDTKLQMTSKLLDLHSSDFELSKIKASVNAIYLAWKLQCSKEVAADMLSKQPSLCTKSLGSLERVCEILLEKFELPLSKVHSSPSLLTLDCNNLEELMLKVPKICGISIQHIVMKQPLIVKRSAKSVHDTARVLENYGVTDVQLLSCTKILNFSACTVSSRLDRLMSTKNAAILRTSKRFLWLIFYFNNVNKTKKIIEELGMPCSLNMLVNLFGACILTKEHYKQKSRTKNRLSNTRDFFFYLSVIFDDTVEAIKMELEHNPNISLSSAQNAQKVTEYLTDKGLTKEQLRNGLDIVLYDADLVAQYFTDLRNRKDLYKPFSKWIGHLYLIQLLIYAIEKDQNFTGNGVYARATKKETHGDEDEEMLVAD